MLMGFLLKISINMGTHSEISPYGDENSSN